MIDKNQEKGDSHLIQMRKEKLAELKEEKNFYKNSFRRTELARNLLAKFESLENDELVTRNVEVSLAGRLMTKRVMGKASFAHLQDMSGQIQMYVARDIIGEAEYKKFKKWDLGDFVWIEGVMFRTQKGELSVSVKNLSIVTKALRPMPEKWHGLSDTETKYRQRYLDLIMSEQTRAVFLNRSKIIQFIRNYFDKAGFLEVETPMMHPIPGGATARPFITRHNALDMDFYLRIAPELYLKKLVIGGFEKVFEINRSFRNEGLSTKHNPEFTMLEFYEAYADYKSLMNFTERLMSALVLYVAESQAISYQGHNLSFELPFEKMSMIDAVKIHNPELKESNLRDLVVLKKFASMKNIAIEETFGFGKILTEIFEKTCETKLIQPTFITDYPVEVSPLARKSDDDLEFTDRFEFFVAGREVANGFSELNDPADQAQRFRSQLNAKTAGDKEAMAFDQDYINALEYGMPPTAGEGIGIDRLVMILTDSPSIRDVLLFPHLRPVTD